MAKNISVKIKGLNDAKRHLDQFPSKFDNVVKQALTMATINISGWAKYRAPVKTGTLRRSITQFVMQHKVKKVGNVWRGKVGSNIDYAPPQEYGTERGIKPKYFFRRSIAEGVPKIKNYLQKAMKQAIMFR